MEEIVPGIWHWTAQHPKSGWEASSYFLPDTGVLLDPIAPPEVMDRLEELGPPRGIVLSNRHHYRNCGELAERFGLRVRAPRVGMHEFDDDAPVDPYDFGEQLAGEAIVVHEVGAICPDEAALHIPSLSALGVADGVINYDGLSFVPDDLMDEPERTKQALKEAYARVADELEFEHLLTAHGEPVVGGARDKLRRFAAA
jgi:hypothetical protein